MGCEFSGYLILQEILLLWRVWNHYGSQWENASTAHAQWKQPGYVSTETITTCLFNFILQQTMIDLRHMHVTHGASFWNKKLIRDNFPVLLLLFYLRITTCGLEKYDFGSLGYFMLV